MSKFRHGNAARDAHITSLRIIIAILAVLCAGFWYGWQAAPQSLTIHNPPDLRSGSTRAWWKVPPSTAYAFGFYIWQQINHWPKSGKVDYESNLKRYRPYLTPGCYHQLMNDYQRRVDRHELADRVRTLQEIPGRGYQPDNVKPLSHNAWAVQLDAMIKEHLYGMPVREMYIRYYLRVVRADVDPEANPFGLQLACFAKPAVELTMPTASKSAAGS